MGSPFLASARSDRQHPRSAQCCWAPYRDCSPVLLLAGAHTHNSVGCWTLPGFNNIQVTFSGSNVNNPVCSRSSHTGGWGGGHSHRGPRWAPSSGWQQH